MAESNAPEVTIIDLANGDNGLNGRTVIYTKINGETRNLVINEVTNVAVSKAGDPYMRCGTVDLDNNNEEADKTLRLENLTLA